MICFFVVVGCGGKGTIFFRYGEKKNGTFGLRKVPRMGNDGKESNYSPTRYLPDTYQMAGGCLAVGVGSADYEFVHRGGAAVGFDADEAGAFGEACDVDCDFGLLCAEFGEGAAADVDEGDA